MYNEQENECESEEDCGIYFLRPVNEYNIVDKIKEANKELFAIEPMVHGSDHDQVEAVGTNKRVQFSAKLHYYESDDSNGAVGGDDVLQESHAADLIKFQAIDEEEEEEEIAEILTAALSNTTDEDIFAKNVNSGKNNIQQSAIQRSHEHKSEIEVDEEIVEEICEDLCTALMLKEPTKCSIQPLQQEQRKKLLKQATFNVADDKVAAEPILIKDAKKLLPEESNTIENESKCDYIHINNNLEGPTNEDYADNDEEDQLSVLVASYLPDDFDIRHKIKFLTSKKNSTSVNTKREQQPFSFRRYFKGSPSNGNVPPPQVTTLKFNYRTCCEYRHAVTPEKLPKYTGYLSEYGLTREQIVKSEQQLQRKQRVAMEKALHANDQEMRKMQDNERAFTKWLKRKMCSPINKTRNMFDVKPKSNSNGGKQSVGSKENKSRRRNLWKNTKKNANFLERI